jgi:hypothetical protein
MLRWSDGLWTLPTIRREKEREARGEEWAWLLTGNIGAGYDSNIFEGPEVETGSSLLDAGLRAEMRRYFNSKDRLRLWAEASALPYNEASDPNRYTQRIGMQYRHRQSTALLYKLDAGIKHENDHVVNTEGEDPFRDFEHFQYEAVPSLKYNISKGNAIWFAYRLTRRNYSEQPTLVSLDYWLHGPSFRWRKALGPRGDFELDYAFRIQEYDEELASVVTGEELPANPTEEHHYHRLQAEFFWRPHSRLELDAGYEFETKDDRFESYESWDNDRLFALLTWRAKPKLTLRLAAALDDRDYDNRPGDGGSLLQYDKLTLEAAAGFALTEHITPYVALVLIDRDTNRSFGNDFRDYNINRFSAGVSFTY